MNRVILMGRLTADPEIRATQTGTTVANYTLAVDGYGKDKTDFIPCVAWDKRAAFAEQYLFKGMKILVTGRLQTGSYTRKDGTKVKTTDVIVDEQEFAESKAANDKARVDSGNATADDFVPVPDDLEGMPFK